MTSFKSRIRMACAASALVVLISAVPTGAQPMMGPGGFGWGPGVMMGPGWMGSARCGPGANEWAEWRIDAIERTVRPTEAQRAAFDALKDASNKAADIVAAACPRAFPSSAAARLAATETRLEAMLQALKTVRPAFDAFYATLNDAQKARLDASRPGDWHWRMWRWRQSAQ